MDKVSQLLELKNNHLAIIKSGSGFAIDKNGKLVDVKRYKELSVPSPHEGAYRFSDLNYEVRLGANWDVSDAMFRVLKLAQHSTLVDDEERELDKELIIGHLKDFIAGGYVSTNWWHNDIGLPLIVTPTMFLCEDFLPEEIMQGLIKYIGNGSLRIHPEIVNEKNEYHRGANLIHYCTVSIRHGIFTGDYDEVRSAITAMEEETYGSRLGLQSDGSFFQHGRRLYSLGYGLGYLKELVSILHQIKNSAFDFSREAKENIVKHTLDGIRHMVGGTGFDYTPSGREYTRTGSLNAVSEVLPTLKKMAELPDMPRMDEIIAFRDALQKGEHLPLGVKYFDVARYLTLDTGKLFISFKGAGKDNRTSEICTSENYMDINLSYGTNTCAMKSGKEYYGISGIWDYSAIPGTTAREESDEVIKAYPDFTTYEVDTDDFGGACDGEVGVCFIGGESWGVKSSKCAIATKKGMIILGAGIEEKNGKPLRTSVEQSMLSSDIVISNCGMEVVHGGILYKNLDEKSPFRVFTEKRSFEFERNGRRITPYHVEGTTFNIRIENDINHPSYAYYITDADFAPEKIEVISNTDKIQAVMLEGDKLVAVFHEAGELSLNGVTVKGDKNKVVIETL
jgi:chondroitin AC lyase